MQIDERARFNRRSDSDRGVQSRAENHAAVRSGGLMEFHGQDVRAAEEICGGKRNSIENGSVTDGRCRQCGIGDRTAGHIIAIGFQAIEVEDRAIVDGQVERQRGVGRISTEKKGIAKIISGWTEWQSGVAQIIVAGEPAIPGVVNRRLGAQKIERRFRLISELRNLRSAERLVPNGHVIDTGGGKAGAISGPRPDRERCAGIVVQAGANGCSLRGTVHIERAAAGCEGHRDVVPGGPDDGRAGDERRRRAAGLPPNNSSQGRIGGIERQNVVRKEAVGLAGKHGTEGAATIGILSAGPFHPHTDSSGRGSIEATASGDIDVLGSAEGERATSHPVAVRGGGNRSDKSTVDSTSGGSVSVKRPVGEEGSGVFAGPGTIVEGGIAPSVAQISSGGVEFPKAVKLDERPSNNGIRAGKVSGARRASGYDAGSPVLGRITAGIGITLGQCGARAVRSDGPFSAVTIFHFIHQAAIPIAQAERAGRIIKATGKRTDDVGQAGAGLKRGGVVGDYQIAASGNDCAFGKSELNGAADGPGREINIDSHLIVQFHPFIGGLIARRVIVDFIEDYDTVSPEQSQRQNGRQTERE